MAKKFKFFAACQFALKLWKEANNEIERKNVRKKNRMRIRRKEKGECQKKKIGKYERV